MADVDITSLSVEISAESQGAELNLDKLTAAISKIRTKGSIGKVCSSLDTLTKSISALKSASSGMDGLSKINDFMDRISNVNLSESAKGIRSVASALTRISSVDLKGINLSGLKGKMNSLQNGLSPLSKVDAAGLRSVSSALNSIAKIPGFSDKLDSKTLDDFATSCKKITDALDPLASKIETVGNSFAKLPSNIQKVIAATDGATKASSKSAKSYLSLSNQLNGFMRNMAKLVSLKAIADYLGNAVAKFNDFYEAANMFGVSMGDMTNEASGFIDKMEQLLGIDPSEAMNAMANIYSMTKSFGLAKEQAYTLSKSLTQLGYDLSSLKNIPISQAFTKIRSAMAGELEPMLQLGVDISQARLKQELLALGFNKQVSTLSQADKATLRYIAILKQTTDAQGDFARTLSSPANMIRVLKAQLSGLARDIGSLLYPALKSILPPLIAAVELIREFVQWVAKLMGVKVEFPDVSSASDAVSGVTDAIDNTTKATGKAEKAFKNYIMGFDELNVIKKDKSSSKNSGSGATGNLLGDVDLSGYDMFKNYVSSSVDEIKAKLEKLLPLVSGIAAGFATWAISNAVLTALEKIKGEGSLIETVLKLWKNPIMAAAVAVGIIVARFVSLYQNSEHFRKGLERVRALIYLAAEGFKQGWNISLTDGKLGESLEYLKESLSNLGQSILNLLPESWQEGITSAFDTISKVVKKLDLDVWDLVTTLAGIGLIVSGHPVAGLAVIGFEAISVAVRGLGSENQKTAFGMETDWFNSFKSIGESVANFAAAAVTAIGNIINDIAIFVGWIKNGVSETDRLDLQMNGNFIENFVMGIAQTIHNIGVFVGWITSGVDEADRLAIAANGNFAEKFILLIADVINGIKEAVKWFGNLIDKISKFNPVSVGKNIIDGIAKGIVGKKSVADDAVKAVTDGIKEEAQTELGIHSPSKVFKGYGGYIVEGLVNGISAAKDLAVKAIQSVSDAVKTVGSQLASENYGLGNANVIVTADGNESNLEKTAMSLRNVLSNVGGSLSDWLKKIKSALTDFSDGINAVSDVGKKISDGFNNTVDQLSKAANSIVSVRDSFDKTVSGIKSFLSSTVSNAENSYNFSGGGLKGTLSAIGSVLSNVFDAIPGFTSNLNSIIVAVETAFSAIQKVVLILGQGKDFIVGIVASNPKLAMIAAIVAAIASAFVMAWNSSEKLRDSITSLFAEVKKTATNLYKNLKDAFAPVGESIKSMLDSIGGLLNTVFSSIGTVLSSIVDLLTPIISALGKILVPIITTMAKIIGSVLSVVAQILGVVAEALSPVVEFIAQVLSTVFSILGDIISAVVDFLQPAIDLVGYAIEGIGTILKGILSVFAGIINGMISGVEAFVNVWVKGINLIIGALNKISINIPDWIPGIGGKKFGFNITEVKEVTLPRIKTFADGGFPDEGQIFIARESGTEMVGNMGGHTAVANNDQIVDGIREGVESAMTKQNELLRQQNELLKALLEKEFTSEISVSSISQAISRVNQRNGKTIIPIGT